MFEGWFRFDFGPESLVRWFQNLELEPTREEFGFSSVPNLVPAVSVLADPRFFFFIYNLILNVS